MVSRCCDGRHILDVILSSERKGSNWTKSRTQDETQISQPDNAMLEDHTKQKYKIWLSVVL